MLDEDRLSLAIVGVIAFFGAFRPVFLAVLLDGEILAHMRVSQRKTLLKLRLLAFAVIDFGMLRREADDLLFVGHVPTGLLACSSRLVPDYPAASN